MQRIKATKAELVARLVEAEKTIASLKVEKAAPTQEIPEDQRTPITEQHRLDAFAPKK